MNSRFRGRLPWPLTYSFARAIQQPAMGIWYGEDAKIQTAQKALLHRAQCARAARRGEYTPAMENPT
jgi:fructose-bisphosphate aldolase, class I